MSALALIFSGAAALVYQSVWARMLHRVFGVGDQAIATVLGSFFLGMALGSFAGGRLSHKITSPGRAYAKLETFIAGWALATLLLLPRVHDLYAALGEGLGFAGLSGVRLLLAMLILLPPTIAMGATLPILMRARPPEGSTWPAVATRLYLANTLGAIFGAGLTGFVFLPRLGGRLSLFIAAGLSIFAAALVLLAHLEREDKREDEREDEQEDDLPRSTNARRSPPLYLFLAGATGMASLAGEVLWTRVLRIVVQGTTQAFAAMLVAFLSGLLLGGVLAQRVLRSVRPAAALAVAQLLAGLFVAASIAAVPQLTRLIPLVVGNRSLIPHEPWTLLLISFALLLPLATCLGASLPILFRMAESGDAGSRTGGLLGANTLGGLFGSLAAGFVLVPLTPVGGVGNTLLAVSVLHLLIACTVAWRAPLLSTRTRLVTASVAVAALALVVITRPSLDLPFLLDAWHDVPRTVLDGPAAHDEEPLFLREGRNTTVTVLKRGDTLRLFNDGRPESGMDLEFPGFGREVALLGALPAALAAKTERAMVIGLGGGHTVTTLLGSFDAITVVELEEAVVEAARRMHDERNAHASRPTPFPLDDPRVRLVVDDARARLKLAPAGSLDAVVSQPSHPWLAGSSALYTREFFAEVRDSLSDGGVFSLWVNLFRMDIESLGAVIATLRDAFPHVLAFRPDDSSFILTASMSPLEFGERIERRLAGAPRLEELLRPFGLSTAEGLLSHLEIDEQGTGLQAKGRALLTDDLPRLEFALAALPPNEGLSYADLDQWLIDVPWLSRHSRAIADDTLSAPAFERRVQKARDRLAALRRVELSLQTLEGEARGYIEGLIAESRGEVSEALARYRHAGSGRALTRAEELLARLGERRALIESALTHESAPDDSSAALRAAMALDDREALSRLLDRRERHDMTPARLLQFAEAYALEGCAGVSERLDEFAYVSAPEPFRLLHRCLARAGDRERADRAFLAWTGRRDRDAREAFAAATDAEARGNPGSAVLWFRATLALLPGHPGAATRWLELSHAEGRLDEIREELPRLLAAAEARGDGSHAEISRTAARLGL